MMHKVWISAAILICVFAHAVSAASYNFTASDKYVVKRDAVTFTFTYDPAGEAPPASLRIELDYDDDGTMDYSKTRTDTSGGITQTAGVTIETPGYFEAEAFFTLYNENGETIDRVTVGPVELNVAKWKFPAGACIDSTPALSPDGQTVYFGAENGYLYALDTGGGSLKWHFDTFGAVVSSPAVDSAGFIYFGSEDGSVYCLEPSGALVWEYRSGGSFFSSPAIDEQQNHLYIGSTDNCLHAIELDSGSRLWKFSTSGKISSSPVIGYDRTVYFGSLDGYLYAVNPGGTLKWRFLTASQIPGSPALDSDGTIFFGTSAPRGAADTEGANGVYALSTAGQKKWFAQNLQGFPAAPIIGKSGVVCLGSWDNKIYGIERSGGGLNMYKTFDDDMLSVPALASNGYLFAGATDGSFYGLDFDSGDPRSGRSEYWHYRLPEPVGASAPVTGNGYVYIGTCKIQGETSSGALYCFLTNNESQGTDIGPAENAPWPQFRNNSQNTGMTYFRPGTVAPEVSKTSPAPGVQKFDVKRRSISVTFSMPMEPTSIYNPPDPENDFEGFFGFTVKPFDSPPEDFIIDWNAAHTVFTLTLPEGESFERETEYTATINAKAHAEQPHAEDGSDRKILYDYEWTFRHDPEKSHDNSHDKYSCFISAVKAENPLDFLVDLW